MSGGKATIMVVDDDRDFRRAIIAILTADGYRTFEVADVSSVIKSISELKPGLVLMDLNMPNGLGIDLVRSMRDSSIVTSVVILSGRVEDEEKRELNKLGISGILAKPVSRTDLINKVNEVLDEA